MVSILSYKGRFKQSLILINFITVLHVTVNEAFIAKLNVRRKNIKYKSLIVFCISVYLE